MQQTKPLFVIKKYKSILYAAIIVETVNFIVSLTDSVIAGNALGVEAFAAIGLLAPFLSVATFFASLVSTGAVVNYSHHVGKFDKKRANELFSQGLYTAILLGTVYALALLLLGGVVIRGLSPSEEIRQYLSRYYYIILIVYLLTPITYTLDYHVIADGGERTSAIANVSQIVCNIATSVLFVQFWGIVGIAIATVLSKALFLLISCLHFFSKKNSLRLVRHWTLRDALLIVKNGFSMASSYGFEAILTLFLNSFAVSFFNSGTLVILVAVERFMGLLSLFNGLAMACQSPIGAMRGEKNTKAQRILIKTALRDMIILSGALSLITFAIAPLMTSLFGINSGELFKPAVSALRVVSTTLLFQSVLVQFFVYYITINKHLLAFIICMIKILASPVVLAAGLSLLFRSQVGLWIGLAAAPVVSLILCALIVRVRYGRERFPFLITRERDPYIFIYDFTVTPQTSVEMSRTVEEIMRQSAVEPKTALLCGVITEDVLILISEENAGSKQPLLAECTVIRESDGMRLIMRDSGVIFDITDTDDRVDSFRRYVVSNLMIEQESNQYIMTNGYNRIEMFFSASNDV